MECLSYPCQVNLTGGQLQCTWLQPQTNFCYFSFDFWFHYELWAIIVILDRWSTHRSSTCINWLPTICDNTDGTVDGEMGVSQMWIRHKNMEERTPSFFCLWRRPQLHSSLLDENPKGTASIGTSQHRRYTVIWCQLKLFPFIKLYLSWRPISTNKKNIYHPPIAA